MRNWTNEENELFINIIEHYRSEIENKQVELVKKITMDFAQRLKERNTIIMDRTVQAIYEHISYFDDLLAGVGSTENYARKDVRYFGKIKRKNNNTEHNPTRIWRNSNYKKKV